LQFNYILIVQKINAITNYEQNSPYKATTKTVIEIEREREREREGGN